MNSTPRLKMNCQFKIQKENYLRHLNRLEKLHDGKSPDQVKRQLDTKKVSEAIYNLRRMHQFNKNFKEMQRKNDGIRANIVNSTRVKSVIKKIFDKPSLLIPPKHKIPLKSLQNQNNKLFERINNVKSQFSLRNQRKTERPKLKTNLFDFSVFYQTSRLNQFHDQCLKIKLGKSKKVLYLLLTFPPEQLSKILKDNNSPLYQFQANHGQLSSESKKFMINDFRVLTLKVGIPIKNFTQSQLEIRLMKILDDKSIFKVQFIFEIDELKQIFNQKQTANWQSDYTKELKNIKCKSQGKINIGVKISNKVTSSQIISSIQY